MKVTQTDTRKIEARFSGDLGALGSALSQAHTEGFKLADAHVVEDGPSQRDLTPVGLRLTLTREPPAA